MQTKKEKLIEEALLALKNAGFIPPLTIALDTEPDGKPVVVLNDTRRFISQAVCEELKPPKVKPLRF